MNNVGFLFIHGWGFTPSFFAPLSQELKRHFKDAPQIMWDHGYFSATPLARDEDSHLPPGRWIGIGHSFGFHQLLPLPLEGIVSLGGFTRFCRHHNEQTGTPVRIVERMIQRLRVDPHRVLHEFYSQCGVSEDSSLRSSLEIPLNADLLIQDLSMMAQLDVIPNSKNFEESASRFRSSFSPSNALGSSLSASFEEKKSAPKSRPDSSKFIENGITADLLTDKRPLLCLNAGDDLIVSPDVNAENFHNFPQVHRMTIPTGGHAFPFYEPAWCASRIQEWVRKA